MTTARHSISNLPLHCALYYGAPNDAIKVLIETYEDATEVHNKNEDMPLHLACYKNSSHFVSSMLVEKYAGAASVQNKYGD
jgi:ankyrin repeat protein